MNVNRLFILRIVADDSDGMVQHSAQGLFYKNVARNGTRIVHWYDVPENGNAILRLQYIPGQGFDDKGKLTLDVPNNYDMKWASKISADFEKMHNVQAARAKASIAGEPLPALPGTPLPEGTENVGAIIACHTHNQTHTFTDRYSPEQLATRLAQCFDTTFRMISFNACNAAGKHGQTALQLQKSPMDKWEVRTVQKTKTEIDAILLDASQKQWKGKKEATAAYLKKNYGGDFWDKKKIFTDDGGTTQIGVDEFTLISRFLRQYVKDKNCTDRVIVAGYDSEITAAHPDKQWTKGIGDDMIGRRVDSRKQRVDRANRKFYFLAENGKNGIVQKVAQAQWTSHFTL